jgi:hypothetical protein
LRQRVLSANELVGFDPTGPATVVRDVNAWAKIAPSALTNVRSRLRRAGFVAAIREDLKARTNDRGALSIVVELASARAARAELARQLRDYAAEPLHAPAQTYTPFSVPGIPGAHGFTGRNPSTVGVNVIFSDGPFDYHVGAGYGTNAHDPPTRGQVISAAAKLYRRVHGRPAR